MDTDAARKARRKTIKEDLADVYDDEEASPPEWVDLLARVGHAALAIKNETSDETSRFVAEPDIKIALARRDRYAAAVRERIAVVNAQIRRLNLLAPNSRFTRGTLDAEEILRPLFRTERRPR
jgi:hypothetical protein